MYAWLSGRQARATASFACAIPQAGPPVPSLSLLPAGTFREVTSYESNECRRRCECADHTVASRYRERAADCSGIAGRGREEFGRQLVDAYERGARPADDGAGTGAFLWRLGAQEECARNDDAELRNDGCGDGS